MIDPISNEKLLPSDIVVLKGVSSRLVVDENAHTTAWDGIRRLGGRLT